MNLAAWSFVRPWWLLALLPLGLLLWRLWRAPQRSEAAWRRLIDAHLLAHLLDASGPRARRTGIALVAGAMLAAVLALAGPALEQPQASNRKDVTRLLLLELSPAMTAQLAQLKLKLQALLQALPDGQTALLVYGSEPYLVVPPTTDVQTIALFIPDLATDVMPEPGNRPELALRMAGDILARSATTQRELLWITAGAAGAQLPLAELSGVRLSILLAATTHDAALAEAASRTGGALVRMREDDADVRQLASALAAGAGPVAAKGAGDAQSADFGYWLLLPLLPLAALAFRGGVLALLLSSLLLAGLLTPQPAAALEFPLPALLADYQAWQLLQAGKPDAAAARFADARWRAAAHYRAGQFEQAAQLLAAGRDVDAHYNRGNALARQGQLADALQAYDAALALRADDADARFNRDLVQRLLNQQSETPKGGGGGAPPPSGQTPNQGLGQQGDAERDAARVAEQWLRAIPDQPGSLLRRKLLAEQRRRLAGEAARAW